MSTYNTIIGLEVHVELKTQSKMFCGCSADYFGKAPNTHTCPVCLGLPGALPVPSNKAIDWCVLIAMALDCEINTFSKFDRKNYFYPDIPKGYQISQYDLPFGHDGHITLASGKKIRIRRVHMEEDTGKLMHQELGGQKVSLIDFNRSGVPLVEIVTEPDFADEKEVVEYLKKLQQIVRYLDVSNADMERGDMRLEPNISLQKTGETELPNYKVEVKNINSFRFVEKSIVYEVKRQEKLLTAGERPPQETRGWNEVKQATVSQRLKEEANDYRYFPEPDIPPIRFEKEYLHALEQSLPELPDAKLQRFITTYEIPAYDAEILTRERSLADYYEEAVMVGKEHNVTPKKIANTLINKKVDTEKFLPAELIKTILATTQTASIDAVELEKLVTEVISENEKAVQEYKAGKETVIMFLVGCVMRKVGKKIDVTIVKESLVKVLKK